MNVTQHYDDDALIALLDRPESIAKDDHVSNCETCTGAIGVYQSIVSSLAEDSVWGGGVPSAAPVPATISNLRAAAGALRREDEEGDGLVEELIAGPREEWMPRLLSDSKYRTPGVVRALFAASEAATLKSPAEELELTRLSTEIADHLDDGAQPESVLRLRGSAWRDRAFALNSAGDSLQALTALQIAEKNYDLVPVADPEVGRLQVVKALVMRALDRFDEGLRAIRIARRIFAVAGSTYRLNMARSTEAHLYYAAGDSKTALSLWRGLRDDLASSADPMWRSVLHNMSLAYRETGDLDSALDCLGEAVRAHAAAGESVSLAKARWAIASILVQQRRFDEANAILSDVIGSFESLQMREDVVLAQLDRAEILIIQHRFDEAVAVCSSAIRELKAAGLEQTARAQTAVSYLTEAAAARRATAALARHVRSFVRESRNQPALLFAPPPL